MLRPRIKILLSVLAAIICSLELRAKTTEAAGNVIVTETEYSYDRQGRLTEVRHRMGDEGDWITLHRYSYDAIGRLQQETLGEVDTRVYGYDVRSRLTSVNACLYRQITEFTFGGNVSSLFWKTWENLSFGNTYRFSYDGLSRLVSANSSNEFYPSGRFDVDYQYDLNGNITSLRRMGLYTKNPYKEEYDKYTYIDNISMEYVGNQLSRATNSCSDPFFQRAMNFEDKADEEVEYSYDGNGNTVADLNRGTTTIYDWNNRPKKIEFANGSSTAYIYDAAGVKRNTHHRIVSEWPAVPGAHPEDPELFEARTDYCGDFIYEDSILTRINLEGGYISLINEEGQTRREYHFFHRDHLGNNRVDLNDQGNMCQVVHYYPFGMQWGTGYRTEAQRWKFGGKELDRAAGLDLSDFEARQYDPTTGRFTSVDSHSEDYFPISGYAYCMNNPLKFIDSNGMDVYLYATELPGYDSNYIIDLPFVGHVDLGALATHTFIVVTNQDGSYRDHFAYGSEYDGAQGAFSGKLQRIYYRQDKNIIDSKQQDKLKAKIKIAVPEGMTQQEFDDKVIKTAESFGNNPGITYLLCPVKETQGNCNTSTSTILLKSGVSKEAIKKIKEQIPGISTGFSTEAKPWTAEEQNKAINRQPKRPYFYMLTPIILF